jgi:Flp pilus assembly protein TadG
MFRVCIVLIRDRLVAVIERTTELARREAGRRPNRASRRTGASPHLLCSDDGQSMLEFALCLPPLLLIVTGIFTFGIALNNYLILTNATSVATRQLSISRLQTTDPCALTSAAVIAAAPTLKSANLTFAYVLNGTHYSGTSCSSGSTTTGAAANLLQGKSVQVTVSYPCSLVVYQHTYLSSCTLQSQLTEAVE